MANSQVIVVGKDKIRIEIKDGTTAAMIASRKSHSMFGLHLNSLNGSCMCQSECCMSESGCSCRQCSGIGHVNCIRARIGDSANPAR
jgi:hypothetical protein